MSDPEFQAANEACSELLDGALPPMDPEQQAEAQAQALAFAQCMRDHGIDMPDPEFGEDGRVEIRANAPDDPRHDDDFEAAQEECNEDKGPIGPGAAPAGDDAGGEGD
jgi:hypothetical protein